MTTLVEGVYRNGSPYVVEGGYDEALTEKIIENGLKKRWSVDSGEPSEGRPILVAPSSPGYAKPFHRELQQVRDI